MTIEIRPPAEDELRAAMTAAEIAFGTGAVEDEDWERERKALPASRALAAFDGAKPVALAGAYKFDLTIPGGQLPCAGVTWIGVVPTHRRRGILRDLMRHQLEDVHAWHEPIAALWASEAAIYGRFGYGQAAPSVGARSEKARFALREKASGSIRLVDADEALELFPPVYERVRATRAGMLSRD
jgi:predicted acetyltransferase